MRSYTAGGIVLRRIDLGEKDRILTVYTRELGKLSAVAKGSRRPGSKLSGASEPFVHSKMMLASGRDLDILTQAEVKESFPNVRADISAIAHAVYFMELADRFTEDRQPNPDLFDTVLSALYVLESGTDPELTARYFELQMLGILGYAPQFDSCLRCGRTIGRERVAFSPALGGIACRNCGTPPNDAIWVPGAAASYVRALRRVQPNLIKDMKVPAAARRDVARMLRWHIRYRLERDLKSTEFIRAIEASDEAAASERPFPQ